MLTGFIQVQLSAWVEIAKVTIQLNRNSSRLASAALFLLATFLLITLPVHGANITTYSVGNQPWGLASDGSNIWITNSSGVTVTKIAAASGANVGEYDVQLTPNGVAFDGTNVWVANNGSNTVTKLVASTGSAVGNYASGSQPQGVLFDGSNIWVTNNGDNTVTKYTPSSGAAVNTYPVGNGPAGMAFDGANVWVANKLDGTVSEVQASTGNLLNTFNVGTGPRSVAFDGMNIWVTNVADGTVSKLLASTGATIGTYTVGENPVGIAFDGANIWVANFGSNNVMELSGTTGAVEATYSVANGPWEVLFDGSAIWVTNITAGNVTKITQFEQPPSIFSGGVVPINSTVTTIQSGEWISIYGSNLAGSPVIWNGNFPTTLGQTSVTIDGNPAYLLYVAPGQIDAQAPNDSNTGPVQVKVTTPGGTATSTVTLAQFGPAFNLLDGKHVAGIIPRSNGTGTSGGGAYDIIGPTGNSLGYPTVAAKAGDTVELYGVGFGPVIQPVQAGPAFVAPATPDSTTNQVTLTVNGKAVTPPFAGLSSQAGLYQINLTIPANLGTGDVSLVATVGGVSTPTGVVISLQ